MYDEERPAGYQDADIELREMEAQAADAELELANFVVLGNYNENDEQDDNGSQKEVFRYDDSTREDAVGMLQLAPMLGLLREDTVVFFGGEVLYPDGV